MNLLRKQEAAIFLHIASIFFIIGYEFFSFDLDVSGLLSDELITIEKIFLLAFIVWVVPLIILIYLMINSKKRKLSIFLAIFTGIFTLSTLPISIFTIFVLTRDDVKKMYK